MDQSNQVHERNSTRLSLSWNTAHNMSFDVYHSSPHEQRDAKPVESNIGERTPELDEWPRSRGGGGTRRTKGRRATEILYKNIARSGVMFTPPPAPPPSRDNSNVRLGPTRLHKIAVSCARAPHITHTRACAHKHKKQGQWSTAAAAVIRQRNKNRRIIFSFRSSTPPPHVPAPARTGRSTTTHFSNQKLLQEWPTLSCKGVAEIRLLRPTPP